jgi:hypothetical protein
MSSFMDFASLRRSRLCGAVLCAFCCAAVAQTTTTSAGLHDTLAYIKRTWHTLERSNKTLLKSADDVKVGQAGTLTLYVSQDVKPQAVNASLRRELPPGR